MSIRPIRNGVTLLSAVAITASVLVSGLGLFGGYHLHRILSERSLVVRAVRVQGDVELMHDALRGDVLWYHSSSSESAWAQFDRHIRELTTSIDELQSAQLPARIKLAIGAVAPALDDYAAAAGTIIDKARRNARPDARELERFLAQWHELAAPLAALSTQIEEMARNEDIESREALMHYLALLLICSVVTIVLAAAVAVRTARSVLRASEELIAARESAEAASQSRADFLAAMSHELRTPLTGVLGGLDLLACEKLNEKQHSYVHAIRSSGRHLLHVIDDILDFSRFQAGKLELEHIDFSVTELLERLRCLVHPQADERGLELRFEVPGHVEPVRGDPTRLNQVLLNLLGNAIKFTQCGSVTVSLSRRADDGERVRLRFEVRDTGIGIAPEALSSLFAEFTQADRSVNRRFGGTGLGLAISKRLVEAMGGDIGVESALDEGSTFWFEIPFEPGCGAAVEEASHKRLAKIQPRRILIAEDVEISRALLQDMLTKDGHELVSATNGAEAVALASQQPFDLILMDIQMPVMDGVEATRRIRALPGGNRDVAILALTASVLPEARARHLAAGITATLMKPIQWEQVTAAIARYGRRAAIATENPTRQPDAAETADLPDDRQRVAAAPAPAASASDGADEVPLLSWTTVEMLGTHVPPERLSSFLRDSAREAESLHDELLSAPAAPQESARRAHRLKGAAGTLGLLRIGTVAGEIETAGLRGQVGPELVSRLGSAVTQTWAELHRSGLVPRHGEDGGTPLRADAAPRGTASRPAERSAPVMDRPSRQAA
ncbi:MAG TPA: ATP-binding protein [Microvirga sp.]|nr:ATP-binding protein [Microvirga sp.]